MFHVHLHNIPLQNLDQVEWLCLNKIPVDVNILSNLPLTGFLQTLQSTALIDYNALGDYAIKIQMKKIIKNTHNIIEYWVSL